MDTFKERLQYIRKEKNLSQAALAERIGKSGKAVISSWEVGNAEPSLSDLQRLAEALGTTSCWLLDGIAEGKSPVAHRAPEGFALIELTELVDLQRKALKWSESENRN